MSLKNFTASFNDLFHQEVDQFKDKVLELENMIKNLLLEEADNLFITNISKNKSQNKYYCLALEKGQITFAQKDLNKINKMTFDLENISLFQNNEEVSLTSLDQFIVKIKTALKDVKNNKAKIYE
jgi:hypothetical protein